MFKQPFFISPHAINRFRERVADLSAKTIITIIQAALQDNQQQVEVQGYNRQLCPVFRAKYLGIEYLIPVMQNKSKKGAWPFVPTVLLPEMKTYTLYERRGWNWQS